MNKNEELSFYAGEKSMSFLPLDTMLDSYSEPRVESYCTISRIKAPTASSSGELELHHHLIIAGDWTSHTIESYTYYVKEGSTIRVQDTESGERHELKVTSLRDNSISLLVL